jgi:hypothetical protein
VGGCLLYTPVYMGFLMPKVGIEPTLRKEHEFESCASASSATSAFGLSEISITVV